MNISLAAAALNTSQPGISRQIRLLEEELGCNLLVRKRNRILGLTEDGQAISDMAAHVLQIIDRIRRVPGQTKTGSESGLKLATTPSLARYVLPKVAKEFQERFPRTKLSLVQGDADQTIRMVMAGEADVGVSTRASSPSEDIAFLPYLTLYRDVITPPDHPLLRKRKVTLRDLADFPMVNLNESNAGGLTVVEAFRKQAIVPNIVLQASDIATLKACVEQGLGIATLPTIARDPERDGSIRVIDGRHLFEPTCNYIVLRRGDAKRPHILGLIGVMSANWTPSAVKDAVFGPA